MQGERDTVVSNAGALRWFSNTRNVKKENKSKIMFSKACHELHKEPMNAEVLKHALKFIARMMSKPGAITWERARDVRQGLLGKIIRSPQVKLARMLIFLYLVIGLLFVMIKKRRRLFIQWPGAILSNLAIYK